MTMSTVLALVCDINLSIFVGLVFWLLEFYSYGSHVAANNFVAVRRFSNINYCYFRMLLRCFNLNSEVIIYCTSVLLFFAACTSVWNVLLPNI
jgi:hypothetical protein